MFRFYVSCKTTVRVTSGGVNATGQLHPLHVFGQRETAELGPGLTSLTPDVHDHMEEGVRSCTTETSMTNHWSWTFFGEDLK